MPRLLVLAVALLLAMPAFADEAQTLLHILDYMGVDYAGAVEDGKVKSADEYKEMMEFAGQVQEGVARMGPNPKKQQLAADAASLKRLVEQRAAPPTVSDASANLRRAIVAAYGLKLAPRNAPDPTRGKALYAQQCAACHGAEGRGDGPAAKGLEPPPADFHDAARMAKRSAYGLFSTITLGVSGTSMPSFAQLSDDERWALAFFVSGMPIPRERAQEGEKLWRSGEARDAFPNLDNLATLSREEVVKRFGEKAALVQDYLRLHPEAVKPSPIAFSRQQIGRALEAYRGGDRAAARQAALSAYLEGFELVEASLANVDEPLMRETEREMLALRGAIERGEPVDGVAARVQRADHLLASAQERLGAEALAPGTAFATSLLILLREGLEAMLVLAAIIAFVAKTGRRDAMRWVHAGWMAALLLGALTWVAATFLIDISGANRELTEGVTALFAAAVLLYVGYWLHGKSYAQGWSRFLRQHVDRALEKRTLWAMASVSFLAVYREMFEIVLFYQALWLQAAGTGRGAIIGGAAAAAALLGVAAIALFKYSLRLPIGPFFNAMSILLALLAVVFAGHGVAALQEAGVIGTRPLGFSPLPLLGVYPSVEAIGAQLLALALVLLGFWAARRSAMVISRASPEGG